MGWFVRVYATSSSQTHRPGIARRGSKPIASQYSHPPFCTDDTPPPFRYLREYLGIVNVVAVNAAAVYRFIRSKPESQIRGWINTETYGDMPDYHSQADFVHALYDSVFQSAVPPPPPPPPPDKRTHEWESNPKYHGPHALNQFTLSRDDDGNSKVCRHGRKYGGIRCTTCKSGWLCMMCKADHMHSPKKRRRSGKDKGKKKKKARMKRPARPHRHRQRDTGSDDDDRVPAPGTFPVAAAAVAVAEEDLDVAVAPPNPREDGDVADMEP